MASTQLVKEFTPLYERLAFSAKDFLDGRLEIVRVLDPLEVEVPFGAVERESLAQKRRDSWGVVSVNRLHGLAITALKRCEELGIFGEEHRVGLWEESPTG